MSEVTGSEAGTGPSLAQGSTGPPEEEEVLGGTGGPQGSALGGVTATREEGEMQGRVNATHRTYNAHKWRGAGGWAGSQRSSLSAPPSQLKPTEVGGGGRAASPLQHIPLISVARRR